MPALGQLTGDLGRVATEVALAQSRLRAGRGHRAEGGRGQPRGLPGPGLAGPGPDGAAAGSTRPRQVLREAIDAAKAEPDRWITLVRFLVLTRRSAKAEQVVREAEAHIARRADGHGPVLRDGGQGLRAQRPGSGQDRGTTEARGWFARAQAGAEGPGRPVGQAPARRVPAPDQPGRRRRGAAQGDHGARPPTASRRPWPPGPAAASPGSTSPPTRRGSPRPWRCSPASRAAATTPDDLRVLAMIHEAQGTAEGRRQAIADLEALIGRERRARPRTAASSPSSWRPSANGPAPASSTAS